MRTKFSKLLSILLCLVMALTLLPTVALAAGSGYQDTDGHWAETAIDRWSAYGILEGDSGNFNPDGALTRAQMAAILSRLLNLPDAPDAGFSDVKPDDWFAEYINKCAAAGIMLGDNGKANPNEPITRQQAIVMIARALGIQPIENPDLTKYADAAQVSAYAQGYVAALIEAGIVGGVTADLLAPQANINRASTVTIFDRAIGTYANEAGQTIKADGDGLILIVAKDVKLTDVPEGTRIVVADGATGLTVNGKAVSDDQTYIVPETTTETPSGGSSSGGGHSHRYTYTDNGDETHTGVCACGMATAAVAHTAGSDGKCTVCGAVLEAKISTVGYTKLADALAAGGTVTLLKDIYVVPQGIGDELVPQMSVTKDTVLDLNGKTLGVNAPSEELTYTPAIMEVTSDATLTINGPGTISAEAGNNNSYGIDVYGGHVIVNGGNYYGAPTALQVKTGSLVINDGFFDLAPTCKVAVPQYAKYVVNAIDAAYESRTATIEIKGGTFVNFDPSANPEGTGTSYVADGYDVLSEEQENDETWHKIVDGTVVSTEAELTDALTDENIDTIYLADDIDLTVPIEVKRSVTIIGADEGSKLTIPNGNSQRVVNINDNTTAVTLTMKNVDVVGPTSGTYTRGISAYNNSGAIEIILDNCSVSCNYYALNIASENVAVTVSITDSTLSGWCAIQSYSNNAQINVSGSELIGTNDKSYNADGWNNFATLVINSGVTGNNWVLENTEVVSSAVEQTGKYNGQLLIDIREGENTVTLDSDCTLTFGENRHSHKYEISGASKLVIGDTVYQGYELTDETAAAKFGFTYTDTTLAVNCKDTVNAASYRYFFYESFYAGSSYDYIDFSDDISSVSSITVTAKNSNHVLFAVDVYQMTEDGAAQMYIGSLVCEVAEENN